MSNWWVDNNVIYKYNGILSSLRKKGNPVTYYNMDIPRGHHAKWIKSFKKDILYNFTYMRYLK